MATTQSHWEGEVPTSQLDGAVKDYSKDIGYLIIFFILFGITVVEVLTYFFTDFPLFKGHFLVPTLLILAAIKFWLVAQRFMHLHFDKRILSVIFYSGLVLAICVYIAVLTIFRIWWPDHHFVCNSSPQLVKSESLVQSQTVCPVEASH